MWFSGEGQKQGPGEGGFPAGAGGPSSISLPPSLPLSAGDIFSILRVQGCTSQAGCNLLNGTQKIGPIEMSEDCSPSGGYQRARST